VSGLLGAASLIGNNMAKPGDLSRDVYTAAWYNKIEKLAAARLGVPAAQIAPSINQTIRIQNVSGSPLKKWQVVRYNFADVLVDYNVAIDHRHNYIIAQTTTTGEKYAIMMDATPDGRLGEALIVGRSFVLLDAPIDRPTDYHDFLRLDSAQKTQFITFGNIQLIDDFNAGSVNLGYCTIGNINPIETGIARTSSSIPARVGTNLGSGTADEGVIDHLFDTVGYTGPSVPLFNALPSVIPTATQVLYVVVQGVRLVISSGGATIISFTLTTDLTTTATATISTTTDPASYPVATSITLTNPTIYGAFSGARGTAILVGTTWIVLEVNRPEALIHVTLSSNSHAWTGDPARGFNADQIAVTTSFEDGVSEYPVNFLSTSITISNPYNHNWLSGDRALLRKHSETEYFVVKVFRQIALRFRFVVTVNAPSGLTPNITATAICPSNSENGPPPTGTLTLKDIYGLAVNAKIDHKGIAEYDFNNDWYYITECEHTAWRFRGTLSGSLSGGASFFNVTPVRAFDGKLPVGTTVVYNMFSWDAGTNGHIVAAEWNPVDGRYEAYQMRCPS